MGKAAPLSDTPNIDLSVMQKADLFSGLLEGELAYVLSRSSAIQLRKDALLFQAGEKAERFYLLVSGAVRAYRRREDGGTVTEDEMARFAPGDVIGDFDFARGASYDADAKAMDDSWLVMFPGYSFRMEQFAASEPRVISRILLSSIMMMTGRIKSTQRVIMDNLSWVQELQRRAYEDPGTGLWKQSFLRDEINRILESPTALVMCKPDRFKLLVDTNGHEAGDEAMVRIAMALKNITRRLGRGWPLRFKSNETGILMPKCDAAAAEEIAAELRQSIAAIKPVELAGNGGPFRFSATVTWSVWPEDNASWENLFNNCYSLLLETWRSGSDRCVRALEAV